MILNCGAGEDSWESLGQQWCHTRQSKRKSILSSHWKDWCWSWNANSLVTWWEKLTHWKRPWCWERLKAGGKGDDKGCDGWMASPTRWTWVWASSRSWWWTGKLGSAAVHGVAKSWTRLSNWIELNWSHIMEDDSVIKRNRILISATSLNSSGGSDDKASAYNVGDPGSIPGMGRSSGKRNGNPLQYSCLENPMDRGALEATVGVTKSWTWLRNFTSLG